MGPTEEQRHAIEAATNRTEGPLEKWTRPCQEECPICFLPMPFDDDQIMRWACCGKQICSGCLLGQIKSLKASICPFCRADDKNNDDRYRLEKDMEHANRGDPHYISRIAGRHFQGKGLEKNTAKGLRLYHRAMEAGSADAAYRLGVYYMEGDGVDEDIDKAKSCFQKAGDLGYIPSYVVLGDLLILLGEIEDAVLNWRKAMICGMESTDLFHNLRSVYRKGVITKEEFAFTLKEHQASVDAMRSKAREEARNLWSEDEDFRTVIALNA